MKVAVMTDSNSGITQREAKDLGVYVIPMPFTINGEEFEEDINLSQEDFYKKLIHEQADIFTSQPAVGDITKYWNQALEDHDQIVHIPMSSGLSGSCQTALMLAEDEKYAGKVFVVDSQRISVTQKWDVFDALYLAKEGKSGQEIRDLLLENKLNATIYITVPTLDYLKKGGRVTPAAAALGGLLKIKPILSIQGEKLDKFATARTMKKARKMMIDQVKADIVNRHFGDYRIAGAYTYDKEDALDFKAQVEEAFPGHKMMMDPLSLSVACHIGPGSLALAACKKLTDSIGEGEY
ncbi:DegV family protein [Sharpea azabuensis]|uniref:EDD domain protein, DegV family n=1 Tax=Sharpea azabuensis TaxID=322505 RepID=A0A1H6QHM0_9FIRM|nr:DegV family protein [Sharpea azabuensis]HCJ14828.1 DegV family protein [Erysipelotrichaceae bacterium]MDD6512494.1 DegV family protein [Sharpea azabuensis]MEE3308269.1 DegV family protein [Sharpea azabuensis]SEI39677.1 EDD domain protein, DegV family [Sharpea azabuensis]SFD83100.1 EDD domain protein, DegV family [Sharpea azabuensis]